MDVMLRLRPVVLLNCQRLRHCAQKEVIDLDDNGDDDLPPYDAVLRSAWPTVLLHVAEKEKCENDHDEQNGRKDDDDTTEDVLGHPLLPGVEVLHLSCHRIRACLAPMLRTAGLQLLLEVQAAPLYAELRLLSPPEVWQEDRPDADEDAEGESSEVVGRAAHHVDELEHQANDGAGDHPLPVETHPHKIEGNPVSEVVAHLVGVVIGHPEPVPLAAGDFTKFCSFVERKV
mmetsp:Transcript_11199/g.25113  ORF Transcript_11199/g.25113 Transcript_11199/m.25113 type:complete len:230 (+) Transcript_11199:1084-1773(+)